MTGRMLLINVGPERNTTILMFSLSAHPYNTDDRPLWSGLLSSTARASAICENRGHCLTATKTHTPSKSVDTLSLTRVAA